MMKKLLTIMLLACSTAVLAQTDAKRFSGDFRFRAVPQAFTLDGKAMICLISEENDRPTCCTILDENLQEVRKFNFVLPEQKTKREIQERKNYTGDWETEVGEYSNLPYIEVYLHDWRTTYADDQGFYLTQNLFNNDADLEYIVPLYGEMQIGTAYEEDRNGDGEVDYKETWYSSPTVGFSIVSESGSTIKSVNFGDGITSNYSNLEPDIYLVGDKCYLAFEVRQDNDRLTLIYSIDRATNAIQQVAKHKGPSVSPTIADRSETVSVRLEESGAREVQVVNAAGKTVLRIPVKAGQHEVNFSAHHLSRGVNVVNVIGTKENSSTKVIVK